MQKVHSLESTIEILETSHDQLARSLEAEKRKIAESTREMEQRVDGLIRDLETKITEIDSLKKRLSRYSDYDELRRELEIMKVCSRPPIIIILMAFQYVEFAGVDTETDGTETRDERLQLPDPNGDKASEAKNQSLEALLASKNKRLQDELAKFRVCYSILVSFYLPHHASDSAF